MVGDSGKADLDRLLAGMVETARSAGEEQGLANIEYRVEDAEHMDLGDDSVDGVICRFGYMLMADPAAALAETRRVLRAGGRLVFSVWGAPDRNPWVSQLGRLAVDRGLMSPPRPGMPGIFGLADPDRSAARHRCGLRRAAIDELGPSGTLGASTSTSSSCRGRPGRWRSLCGTFRTRIGQRYERELHERMSQFESDGGFRVPRLCLSVVAQ